MRARHPPSRAELATLAPLHLPGNLATDITSVVVFALSPVICAMSTPMLLIFLVRHQVIPWCNAAYRKLIMLRG